MNWSRGGESFRLEIACAKTRVVSAGARVGSGQGGLGAAQMGLSCLGELAWRWGVWA